MRDPSAEACDDAGEGLSCCDLDSDTHVCTSGIRCPTTAECSADGTACIDDACGNGVVDPGEVCDDGNNVSGDGCRSDCLSDETCGNSRLDRDTAVPEECDDGPNGSLSCTRNCRVVRCGDGEINGTEECDDGPDGSANCNIFRWVDGDAFDVQIIDYH